MPAHLESTDSAMKAEYSTTGKDRRARMEDQDKDHSIVSDVAASGVSPRQKWRARMSAAVILKQKNKRALDSDEKGSEN